jgi:RHH-type proline utilization regulon transcriptional repressor/proline dehydrogenase/delta 1-pyrroline-5-carboxylate dehydrogenase
VGAALVADARVQGVLFTGSTDVARLLHKTLAQRLNAHGRPVPLIAETGGQNAMIVDSSALTEQVVADAVASAFDSAGQRCSALRVLCVQSDVAERVIAMLQGAMVELAMGAPNLLATDVGPVIDADAQAGIEQHVQAMAARGRRVFRAARVAGGATREGSFVKPTLIEIGSLAELQREVFGPVLHVLRYKRQELGALIAQINATGYGLTLGVHTRIDETIEQVSTQAHAGNVYVNRNMVGAVVGVQPFGGEGLSGTGPKAGGPLYLQRLLARPGADAMARAMGATESTRAMDVIEPTRAVAATDIARAVGAPVSARTAAPAASASAARPALAALQAWADQGGRGVIATHCRRFAAASRSGQSMQLPGPTGERNTYRLQPRDAVLCLATHVPDRLVQLAAVLAVGSTAVWPAGADTQLLLAQLPEAVRRSIVLAQDWKAATVRFDAALQHGDSAALLQTQQALAARPGPIVGLRGYAEGDADIALEALLVERALSVNTAAAGGNASLMAIG